MKAVRKFVLIGTFNSLGLVSFVQAKFVSLVLEVHFIVGTLFMLCGAVYAFHEPKEQVDVKIVFIHDLEFDGSKEAYWKTWLARDGTQDNCWPKTWLAPKFPHARILSLSYDATIVQTSTSGRMDPYCLGESLVQEMVLVEVGQQGCPVLFVCHGLGGLVAKQIVVTASHNFQGDEEVQNLLRNLQAFYFYATPHGGAQVGLSPWNFLDAHGPWMSYLKIFSPEVGRLNSQFEHIHREVYNNGWLCFNVGGVHATSHERVFVPESSARQVGGRFLSLDVGHFDICRPQSQTDTSYLSLTKLVSKVIKVHEDKQGRFSDLPKVLVGMDDKVEVIGKKLHSISIFGLVGMGGIGKTTISKYVYNLQAKFYDKACFLQDVRSKGLASVQKELLLELCGVDLSSSQDLSLNHLWLIEQCIMKRRVLVVLDDVGDSKTLKGLQVPAFQRGLGNGSKVIVTCCNRQVLENHVGMERLKDVEIMDVEPLNDDQALELFQYHVLNGIEDEDEMEDLEDLAMAIAKACCGLPLSLEVIGQYLRKQHVHSIGMRKGIWEEALRKLREVQSFDGGDENEVLWRRLKISYDDLSNDTKSMFLDFACFFCEESHGYLSEESIGWIWNSPSGLQNLLARSLIKVGGIDGWGRSFTMHDQLRDMGRRIVKDLSLETLPGTLKNVTRLWNSKEVVSFLEENKGFEIIEGISLRSFSRLYGLQSQANPRRMREMTIQYFSRLRLLDLTWCKNEVVGFFLEKCSEQLSWLCLDSIDINDTPHAINAIGFCTGLRVFQMRYSLLLEELPIVVGKLVHLLELDLSSCHKLQSLPNEIGHLKQLKRLQLKDCMNLTAVPASVSHLINLEYLGLQSCYRLVSMVEFETQMHHLYQLDLSQCFGLRIPFKSLDKLYKLHTLNMAGCKGLVIENPSQAFGHLSRLKKLNLSSCDSLIFGFYVGSFNGEHAQKQGERLWDQVIQSFSIRLQELHLPVISKVGFPTQHKLKFLKVYNGFHLEELPTSLEELTQLEELIVHDIDPGYLKKLPNFICSLVKLKVLQLSGLGALDTLPNQLGHLSLLKTLEIHGITQIEELPGSLGQLIQLEVLDLEGCVNLKHLCESFTSLTRLSTLKLKNCDKLVELPISFGQLSQLEHLDLKGYVSLKHLPESLTSLTRLSILKLKNCDKLEELPTSFGQLVQLVDLDLEGCVSLKHLPKSFMSLTRLSTLNLRNCNKLVELPTSLSQLVQLQVLNLEGCLSLKHIPKSFSSLTRLSILS